MARLYANECFSQAIVNALRDLGHDVLTSLEAGNANQQQPDESVLDYATANHRAVITANRKDFIRLHKRRNGAHQGIIVVKIDEQECKRNAAEIEATGQRIDRAIDETLREDETLVGQLIRVKRPQKASQTRSSSDSPV